MVNKVIGFLARIAIGKQLVAGVAKAHDMLDGKRSEILGIIVGVVLVLGKLGVIPEASADAIVAAISPLLGATIMDRFSKVKAMVDKVVPAPANDSEAKPS